MREKRSYFLMMGLVGMVLVGLVTLGSAEEAKYLGSGKCKMCHSSAKMAGEAYKVWSSANHSKAFETLKSDKAKEAAKQKGIADPATDKRCLKCHTTPTLPPEDGVSCEHCHGAASNWQPVHSKKDKPAKEALIGMGMKDLSKQEVREALCMECHKEDPDNSFHKPFKYDEFWAKIKHGGKPAGEAAPAEAGKPAPAAPKP